jgi:hypothetical protein
VALAHENEHKRRVEQKLFCNSPRTFFMNAKVIKNAIKRKTSNVVVEWILWVESRSVFGMSRIRTSTRKQNILSEILVGFFSSLMV